MSENTPAREKMKLSALLQKVSLVAAGVDAEGVPPGAEGHDPKAAPDVATRWCASVLRILIGRVIEHVLETRRAIFDLRGEVLGRPEVKAAEGVEARPAVKGLAEIRAEVAELSALVGEIVAAIKAAQKVAEQAGAAAPGEPAAGGEEGAPSPEASPEAHLNEIAARIARGEKVEVRPPAAVAAKPSLGEGI